LAFWNRADPADGKIQCKRNDAKNPNRFAVLHAIVPENYSANNTTEVADVTFLTGRETIMQISILLNFKVDFS
jgi:hypothetical protein